MSLLLDTLRWQFRMTWSLGRDHWVPAIADEMYLWQQAPTAATITLVDGRWAPDWDEEPDPVPPATIGWLTWHIQWWWTSCDRRGTSGADPAERIDRVAGNGQRGAYRTHSARR